MRSRVPRSLLLPVIASLIVSVLVAAPAAAADAVANVTPPVVTGTPQFRGTLIASPGEWTSAELTYSYQWLRDEAPLTGATSPTYRPGLDDLGRRLSVVVTATDGTSSASAASLPTGAVRRAELVAVQRPRVVGAARFGRTVTVRPLRWTAKPARLRYQWLRNGEPIEGARSRRHAIAVEDVGARISVRVTAAREGYRKSTVTSRKVAGRHRVPLRRTVTYSVATRGHVTANLRQFRRLAQQTFDDPRGWRGTGIGFRRVPSGGAFTLVLSQASYLPGFGFPCSSMWSCRSGNFVIINQDRWRGASPMWNAIGRSLRDYRHMVVNHETGHWLGHGHRYCGGPGRPAPVMQQQSKGLHGCRANPWPLPSERFTPRF